MSSDNTVAALAALPVLHKRPKFPQDLTVLLLDSDPKARVDTEALLQQCSYNCYSCCNSSEAAAHLSERAHSFDILLVEVKCLMAKTAANAAIVAASRSVPLVLMSDGGNQVEMMLGLKLGAAEILQKPVAQAKLKNIWQHTLRRWLETAGVGKSSGSHSSLDSLTSPAQPAEAAPGILRQTAKAAAFKSLAGTATVGRATAGTANSAKFANSAAGKRASPGPDDSASGTGNSGSQQSSSELATLRPELELGFEITSFIGALQTGAAAAGVLRPPSADPAAGSCKKPRTTGSSTTGSAGSKAATATTAKPSAVSSRPAGKPAVKLTAPFPTAKPAMGVPVGGKVPAIHSMPGLSWGFPTNPLCIHPKMTGPVPSALMPALPWGMPPLMAAAGPFAMTSCPNPVPRAVTPPLDSSSSLPYNPAAALTPSPGPAEMLSGMTPAVTSSLAPAASMPTALPSGMIPTPGTAELTRAESAPAPLAASGLVPPIPPPVPNTTPPLPPFPTSFAPPNFDSTLKAGHSELSELPIGLRLKKSVSFCNMINESLRSGNPTCLAT